MILAMMVAIATSASAMSYEQARREALFLADKMAYELHLSDAQYEAAYEANLDYLMSLNGRGMVYGSAWSTRNSLLRIVLSSILGSMMPICRQPISTVRSIGPAMLGSGASTAATTVGGSIAAIRWAM